MINIIETMKNLNEMSENRKEIYRKLNDKIFLLFSHSAKCILYQDTLSSLNHWKKELLNFIPYISKKRNNKKYPTYKELLNNVYCAIEDFECKPNFISNYLFDLEYPKINCNNKLLTKLSLEYCRWHLETLSKNGVISKSEISTKIDELINKYNN